ncbi:DNA-binding protein WhiA [Mycoplasmoides pneumoniae]
MSFSVQIKHELATNPLIKTEWSSFLAGYFQNGLKLLATGQWSFKTSTATLKALFSNALQFSFQIHETSTHCEFSFRASQTEVDQLLAFDATQSDLPLQKAYVIGAFLSGGSVSDLLHSSNFHLQISTNNELQIKQLMKLFHPFKQTTKRHQLLVYVKSYQAICDFFKLVEAFDGYLAFEENQLQKNFALEQVRKSNLEIANLMRTLKTSTITAEQLKILINSADFKKQSLNFQRFCLVKLDHPDWSLEQIAQFFERKYKVQITRSGIQHLNAKLKKLNQN